MSNNIDSRKPSIALPLGWTQPCEVDIIFIPILQMRNLRHREMSRTVPGTQSVQICFCQRDGRVDRRVNEQIGGWTAGWMGIWVDG